jgi:sugar lactone lactonase YvrE
MNPNVSIWSKHPFESAFLEIFTPLISTRRSPVRKIACLIVATLLVGCGGGGGGGPAVHAPVLDNLSLSPAWATLNQGGGSVVVQGNVIFSDSGGDLSEAWLQVYNSAGTLIDNLVIPISAPGITQGILGGAFSAGSTATDVFTINVNVKDIGGKVSNTVSGMFVIALPPSTTVPPTVLEAGHTVIRLSGAAGLFYGSARAESVSIGPTGDVYVADPQWGRIFKLDPVTGSKSLFADGFPQGMFRDICWTPSGKMFATSNSVPGGNVWEVTSGTPVFLATVPEIPAGIRGIAGGSLLVADSSQTIWKVSPAGQVAAFLWGLSGPSALTIDNAGDLYFTSWRGIFKSSTIGSPSPTLLDPMVPGGGHIAVDGEGNLYASGRSSASIYKVSGGKVTLFASGFGGIGVWGGPTGLAFDNTGSLYVADGDNLWKITTP